MSISLSGSLVITGSIVASGGITGSFSGSATTSSYALTASSVLPLNQTLIVSGSTSITGSLQVTGSVSTTGTITAQTLVVQTVTSSIVYSSGSNIFGNSQSNVQQMTGSLRVTGSLSLNNVAIPTSASLASTYLPLTGGTLTGALGGTSATFSDTVAITLTASDSRILGGNSTGRLLLANSGTTTYGIFYGASHATYPNTISLVTDNTERLSIVSSGEATFTNNVTITNAARPYFIAKTTNASEEAGIKIQQTTVSDWYIGTAQGSLSAQDLAIRDVKNSRIPLFFAASTGAATFSSSVTAAGATFSGTTAVASAAGTSQMRIDRSGTVARIQNYDTGQAANISLAWDGGNVGIGTTSPERRLHVANSMMLSSGSAAQEFLIGDTNVRYFSLQTPSGAANLQFNVYGGSNIMTLTSGGVVQIAGLTSNGTVATQSGNGSLYVSSDANLKIEDGYIENGLEKVLALKPRYFYWKDKEAFSADRQLGFYAQEVNAVSEETANTPEEGQGWGIYDRALVALLTKAIQEINTKLDEQNQTIQNLQAENDTLKERLTALENK